MQSDVRYDETTHPFRQYIFDLRDRNPEYEFRYNDFDIYMTHHYGALGVVWWEVVGGCVWGWWEMGVWWVVGLGAGCGVWYNDFDIVFNLFILDRFPLFFWALYHPTLTVSMPY